MRDSAPIPPIGHWASALAEQQSCPTRGEVVFTHFGKVDHAQLERLLALAESASLAANDVVTLRKRLFNVLVEGLENVHRHTPEEWAETGFAVLVRSKAGYRIAMGNALPLAAAVLLSHRVDILNDMDEADLREHYLKLLANEGRTERGGAGLGLLTIARKSSDPMVTHLIPRDPTSAYVALELAVA